MMDEVVGYGGVSNRIQLRCVLGCQPKILPSNDLNLTAASFCGDFVEPKVLWRLVCLGK